MSSTSVDLPEPDTPVTATKQPSGISTVDVLQVVLARVLDADHALRVARHGAPSRTGISRLPVRYAPVIDVGCFRTSFDRAGRDDLPAVLARARARGR